eukprot:s637_g12.t1
MFATSRMGSHVTKGTSSVLDTAKQVRGYLQRTCGEGLVYEEEEKEQVCVRVFTDASFSPEGEESHGCFVVFINRCLMFWRSGRQPTITLSTAESELNEIIEGMAGGEAVAAILYELCETVQRQAWTDSQSAASILVNEGGSWRTRHLKMRSGFARQQVQDGNWMIGRVPGQEMVADIGTKPLTAARFEHLKELLGMGSKPSKKEDEVKEEKVGEEKKEKKGDQVKLEKAALAVRLITLAAILQKAKGQGEEEEEEDQGEFHMMMWIYTAVIVLLTLLIQWVWKGGVRREPAALQESQEENARSLPTSSGSQLSAQVLRDLQQRAKRGARGREEEGEDSNLRRAEDGSDQVSPAQLARGAGQMTDDAAVGSNLRQAEDGSDQVSPPQLARGASPETDGAAVGSETEDESEEGQPLTTAAIEAVLEQIRREESQLWERVQHGAPLPPEDPDQARREFDLGFQVFRSPCGTVYHMRRQPYRSCKGGVQKARCPM